jgi:hypothetical protein
VFLERKGTYWPPGIKQKVVFLDEAALIEPAKGYLDWPLPRISIALDVECEEAAVSGQFQDVDHLYSLANVGLSLWWPKIKLSPVIA